MRSRWSLVALPLSMFAVACTADSSDPQPTTAENVPPPAATQPPAQTPPPPAATNPPAPPPAPAKDLGAVFTIDNDANANHVIAFARGEDGALTAAGTYDTFGRGTGKGLGSQSALALSDDGKLLVAVDAGSSEITSFSVDGAKLTLVSNISAGGEMPVSVAIRGSLVYALNAGDSTISGFHIGADGKLSSIAGSTRQLSGASVGAAQIAITQKGDALVVTEKGTNQIDTFVLAADGTASKGMPFASSGMTPFGFALTKKDVVVVSEAFGGAAGASAASSYTLSAPHDAIASGDMERDLLTVSSSVKNNQGAACWVTLTDKFAYTANAASGNISAYTIGTDGALALVGDGASGATGVTGSKPLDLGVDRSSKRLYMLDGGTHEIVWFTIGTDGALSKAGSIAAPMQAAGVASN